MLYLTEVEVSKTQLSAIHVFDFAVVGLLIFDFCIRMKGSKDSVAKFFLKNSYELPAMLPLLVFTLIEDQVVIGATVRSFRLLRLFRLMRLLQLANLFRTIKYLKKSGFVYFTLIAAAAIIFGSIGIYAVEVGNEASSIRNYEDAVWFSLTSMTISGYGDVYPITTEGRIIAGVLIFVGLALVLGFLASLGATLVSSRLNPKLTLAAESRDLIKKK